MGVLTPLTIACALGCGLIGGIFFAFSTFVMNALGRLPPAQGIAAMRWINIVVINPWFLTPYVGTAVACAFMAVVALTRWSDPRAPYWLAGGLLYVIGTFIVTGVFNIPRNNALARGAPESAEAARLWADYLSTWTAWNHVRTAAALAAALSFILAARK